MQDRSVVAHVSVDPILEGSGHRTVMEEAIEALRGPELQVEVGPTATVVRGSISDVLHAVERAHNAAAGRAAKVVTSLRLESGRASETAGV